MPHFSPHSEVWSVCSQLMLDGKTTLLFTSLRFIAIIQYPWFYLLLGIMFSLPQLLRSAHVSRLQCSNMRFGTRLMRTHHLSGMSSAAAPTSVKGSLSSYFTNPHPKNNVPEGIVAKLDKRLHVNKNHPLGIIKTRYRTT